jgi:hypothetical protein
MEVSPSELSFQAQEGGPNPSNQDITISNSGTGTLTYEAEGTDSWIELNVNALSGEVGPNSSVTIPVGVKISGLSAAAYNGNITITDESGASEVVKVNLELTASPEPPTLTVTPLTLNYTYRIGDPEPASQVVNIEISNGVATWTATTPDSEWLSIVPSTTTSNSYTMAEVKVHPANLDAGTYKGNIAIEAPGAEGSPANVVVNLTVTSSGTISVSCNIAAASFTITGSVNYDGKGQTWTATEVLDGTYTITYDPVIGYRTPPSETKTITNGDDITFEGNYISLAQSANIIVSRGADYQTPSTIGIFDAGGNILTSFTPFSEGGYISAKSEGKNRRPNGIYRYSFIDTQRGLNTAVGDIDGDWEAEIVAGLSPGRRNPAEIAIYRADGTLIEGSEFIALSTMYGANVAVADFDGDGKAEIVVGAGLSSRNRAQVRVFKYESGTIIDTGINFNAFSVKGGVNVAAGDVDGDGLPELITAAGAIYYARAEVKVWKVDTSGPYWSIIDTGIHFIAFPGRYGASVTTGDLNGDGIMEIIVGSGPDPRGGHNMIKAFNGNGKDFGLEITDSSKGYGLDVASADLDSDGIAEIVTGLGPSSKNPSTVKIYKADGKLVNIFNAFNDGRYGAIVSVGELGY